MTRRRGQDHICKLLRSAMVTDGAATRWKPPDTSENHAFSLLPQSAGGTLSLPAINIVSGTRWVCSYDSTKGMLNEFMSNSSCLILASNKRGYRDRDCSRAYSRHRCHHSSAIRFSTDGCHHTLNARVDKCVVHLRSRVKVPQSDPVGRWDLHSEIPKLLIDRFGPWIKT
jgi:hypothetical protein